MHQLRFAYLKVARLVRRVVNDLVTAQLSWQHRPHPNANFDCLTGPTGGAHLRLLLERNDRLRLLDAAALACLNGDHVLQVESLAVVLRLVLAMLASWWLSWAPARCLHLLGAPGFF